MERADPVLILAANGSAQILVSSLLGVFMLVPLQPWAKAKGSLLWARGNAKALLAVHLDLLMLAFMQFAAAFVLGRWPLARGHTIAWLLVFGGWVNPSPYLFRALGINAFVLGGPWPQRLAAGLGGVSVLSILTAWTLVLAALLPLLG
ncbi:MAG TPA: hypothetical protein VH877_17305 [Polyangia bacterium]|jgi:hypothetical protein|nr:hypothetical protein [Polyangia bacterium]